MGEINKVRKAFPSTSQLRPSFESRKIFTSALEKKNSEKTLGTQLVDPKILKLRLLTLKFSNPKQVFKNLTN